MNVDLDQYRYLDNTSHIGYMNSLIDCIIYSITIISVSDGPVIKGFPVAAIIGMAIGVMAALVFGILLAVALGKMI